MAFAFVTTAEANSSGISALTCNKPTGTTDGDIMVAFVFTTTRKNAVPSGWTELSAATGGTSNYGYYVFYKVASSEGASYQWTFTSTGKCRILIATYRGGFNTSDPIDVNSTASYFTNDTTLRAASISVSAVNSPLIFIGTAYYNGATTSFTKPTAPTTGWVEDFDGGNASSDAYSEVCSMVWSGSGATGNVDATIANSIGDKHAIVIALNPAGQEFTISDTLSLSESTTSLRSRLFSVSDSFSLSDAVSAGLAKVFSVVDTVTASDSFTSVKTWLFSIADTIGLTDVVSMIKRGYDNKYSQRGTSYTDKYSQKGSSYTDKYN